MERLITTLNCNQKLVVRSFTTVAFDRMKHFEKHFFFKEMCLHLRSVIDQFNISLIVSSGKSFLRGHYTLRIVGDIFKNRTTVYNKIVSCDLDCMHLPLKEFKGTNVYFAF